MNITICGGGHLGHVCGGVFTSQGHNVSILSGHPYRWNDTITVTDLNWKVYSGNINKISSKASEVIPDADIVLLCLPGYLISKTLKEIKPYLNEDSIVGSIVSSTGFFFEAHKILPPTIGLFGFQRVPFISRIDEYGKSASLLGYKKDLYVALENCNTMKVRKALESLFLTPITVLGSFYEVSLTNSNPLLHTSRLYTMWHSWDGTPFEKQSLFYNDWNDEASEMLISMDNEFTKLLETIGVTEGAIPSILDYYESKNAQELTRKIKSIPAFQSIYSPMIQVEDGWIPDFKSRYFTEDFPYGLRFIKELVEEHKLDAPNIFMVYEWGKEHCDKKGR